MPKNTRYPKGTPLWASQNFLTSRAGIRRLIGLADIGSSDHVLEIGPGKGHITRELLPRCGRLTAVELDPRLWAGLRERFAGEDKLELIKGDFLKYPLPKGPYKVFANLPFSGTSAILKKLTRAGRPPRAAWLIVELGAARRFTGTGLASYAIRPYFDVRIAAKIPRTEFHPMPGVDAALLELKCKSVPDLPWELQGEYRTFLERAFRAGPRSLLTKRQISAALRREGLPPLCRDGNMEYVQWLCLFRWWREFYR
ncbi:rRNA adenine N(6)-methyltransferase family protein [Acutalibacter muris]|uniref:rRNA adenine N-6-methyltransferase n=1 Tax=Acutalibacter muris TaxID=1796620 RepID=A0A1Z2XV75_9FIRM|nr:rRNA adenine N(6)-methyltransferase family protein [Acutalibacter muris]ANU54438.1 hypothetical protein A4V00_10655 [Hungateiclostridiaceae bacterium KB18]ASB42340.1 hypothetical protein ADH66_17790 [Acutalibacter muris]QQR31621.1 rRNA adenine N(6)-methyltransferase family protein [Acutalibacter muris]